MQWEEERYGAIIAALGEGNKNLFIEYADREPCGSLLRAYCYKTGFLDGIALGMNAADRGGVFDA
jgi:hypothetical protein